MSSGLDNYNIFLNLDMSVWFAVLVNINCLKVLLYCGICNVVVDFSNTKRIAILCNKYKCYPRYIVSI